MLVKLPSLITDAKVFFISATEPYYVKYEKLDILTKIINESNSSLILNELKVYLREIDLEFIKKVIKAIALIGIKFKKQLNSIVQILID